MLRRLLRFLSQLSEVVGGNFLLDDGDLRSHRVDDLALEQSVVDFALFDYQRERFWIINNVV